MNDRLMQTIREMDEEELFDAIFRDSLTGALNRRAFTRSRSQVVALVDVDSLKWVNDQQGHRAGDQFLVSLAVLLQTHFKDRNVFRISGDEFAVRANSALQLSLALKSIRAQFRWFSFGIGRDLAEADGGMRYEKRKRKSEGTRSPRGETPPGIGDTFVGMITNGPRGV